MADLEGMFKGVTRQTKRVTVCLLGDLVAEYDDLERQLVAARERDAQSFAGGEERKVVERMNEIRAKMTAAEVTFEFTAMPPMRPLEVLAEHRPREDNKADIALGYNQETYYPALIRQSCTSVTANDGTAAAAGDISDEAWDAMLQGLGHRDFDQLVGAAMEANGRTSVPFSHLASLLSTTSEAESKPPKRGTSRRSGSTVGNRKSSPSSSTTPLESSSVP